MTKDDDTLKPEERERYLATLARAGEKLNELVHDRTIGQVNDVQDHLLGMWVVVIVRAMVGLRRDAAQASFLSWVTKQLRGHHGLCVLCGLPQAEGIDICEDCQRVQQLIDAEPGMREILDELRQQRKGL